VRQLIDLQLLVFEFFVAAGELRGPGAEFSIAFTDLRFALGELFFAVGELRDQGRGQITQFFCVLLRSFAQVCATAP
jgi:hypothetical protein